MASPGGYRGLFGNRSFRYYFASQATGDAGYAVYAIAVVWLAITVSGSLFVAGLVLFVEFGIYALAFLAGPFVDRARDLRSVLLIGYPTQAALAFVLGLLEYLGELTVPLLLVLVVALSFLWDFTWTASNAMLPRIVPTDQLFRANGLSSAVSGGNQLAGYAAGAGLILLVGAPGAAFLYAAMNLAAAALALPVHALSPPRPPTALIEEYREGFRYLLGGTDRPLLQLSTYSAMQAFFTTAPVLLIALLAKSVFPDPAFSYGVLFTAFAFGGVAGSLTLGHYGPRRRLTAVLIGVGALEGLAVIEAIAVAPALLPSLVVWFVVGAADIGWYTVLLVYFQATTPSALIGRTLANQYLFRGSSRATGALLVGALGAWLTATELGWIVGGALIAAAVIGPVLLPGVRRLAF